MSLEIGGDGNEYTTLQDYYDSITIEDGDMIIGNVYLEIPPSHISVNEAYQISSTPGAIRQRSSIKMNKGKTSRAISMSLYFIDPVDAGVVSHGMSNLYEIINLFKYSPFVAVKNKYLNDTWGIDALALSSMSIESDREFPGAYFIQLQVEQFNYKSYVPYAPSFASIIDYGKYVQYLRRGINKTNVEMNGGSFAIGEDHIHSDTDIDFLIHDTIPDRLGTFHSWDDIQDDIVYPRTTLERLKEKYPDLVDTWTFGFGWDSSTTTSHWDSGEVADVIEEISNALGSAEFYRIKEQIRNMYGAELSEAELNFQTVRFVLQQLTLAIQNAGKGTKENPRDLYDLEHESYEETWIEEWAVPMVGMKLSDAVSIHSISASIVNYFARLPILSHEAVAHQYVGGGNMELAINMEIVGEDDVKKLRKLMKRSQDVARLTKAIGTLGFLGVRSDVSRLMGCKYWMPLNLSVDTNPQVPHLYNCSFQLSDFDIYQQEKESWCRQQLSQGMLGNPFMRIKQFGKYFQLYPDLPLEFKEESGWEAPDFYFITTPIVSQSMETRPIGGATKKVASVNGNPFNFTHRFDPVNGITIDFDASDGSGGGSVKFDPPHDKTVSREGWQALFGAGSSQATTGASSSSGMTEEQYQESIRASVMSPYGDATKSPSDVGMRECLMDSLSELQRRDKWGTMATAFPSYALFLIDEPRNMLMFRTFGDFYGRRAVVDLKVHTNQVPMFDTASITVSDVYHKSTVAMDEYEDRDLGQFISTFDQFWDDILNTFGMGDEKIQHMRIEPGMRIQLRMGYGNNVADYPILFNGTITEVAPQGSMLTIIAGGDGRELLGIINPEKNDKTTSNLSYGGLFGLMYSEPRDLLIKLLTLRASIARDALALALKGAVHPGSKGGISHFGMLLHREKPEEDRSTVESAGDYLRDANIDIAVDMIFGNLGLNKDVGSLGLGAENDSSILSGLGSVVFGALGDEGTQALAGMMYSDGEDWSILQKGLNKAKFKEVFKQAIKNIFDGWDTEIFKRNIYPGNGVGALDYNDDPGGNDPVSRLLFTLADTFDFMSFADEPSFKIMCVDEKTECLCKDKGWTTYNDLEKDDLIYTLNIDTGMGEWKPVRFVHSSEFEGSIDELKNGKGFNSLTTRGHRWPVQAHHRGPHTKNKRTYSNHYVMREDIRDVSSNERISLANKFSDFPTEKKYTDTFVELMGWFVTEGYIGSKNRPSQYAFITQSKTANSKNTQRIRDLLLSNDIDFYEYEHPVYTTEINNIKCQEISFRINQKYSRDILSCISTTGNKIPKLDFIYSLTRDQLQLFYDVVHLGDGSYNGPKEYEQKILIQKSKEWLDVMQIVACLLGYATNLYLYNDNITLSTGEKSYCHRLSTLKNNYKNRHQLKLSEVPYKGIVWCPNTENNTFLARRNGYCFMTGNTYQRTIWDIMLNACDVCPNYILAVRPFEHRSTLFFGKQYWKYTSGVEPINEYKRSNFKRTKEISEAIYEKLMEQYSNASGAIYQQELSEISTSAFKVSEYALTSVYPVTNVNGGFIEDLVKGYGLEGCGQLISDCAVSYGVPWELALAMWWMEDQWLTDGQSVKWNNPGNIKWDVFKQFQGPFTASQSTTTSAGDYFAQYPSVSEGIKSWFYYMSKRYPEQLANGDIEGLIYIYAPPSENDSGYYYKTVMYLMEKYKNLAIEANAYEPESKDGWMGGQKPTATPTTIDESSSDGDVVVFADTNMQERYDKFIDILDKQEDKIIKETFKQLFEEKNGYIASAWGLEPLTLGKGVTVKDYIADDSWDAYKEIFIKNNFNPSDVRKKLIEQEKDWIARTLRSGFEKWIKNPDNYEIVDVNVKKIIQNNGFTENIVDWGNVVNAFVPWILIAGKNMNSKVKLVNVATGFYPMDDNVGTESWYITAATFIGWSDADIQKALGLGKDIYSAMNTSEFDSSVSANITRELSDTTLGKVLSFISGIGNILSSVVGLALNLVPFGFQIGSLTKQMMELQKLQDKKLLDSNYYIEGEADNPFTREFQEEVREIREPFSRVHYSTSFTDMINWNVAVNSNDVYPVVTAVSDGKRPVTVYADKSIDSQFQREKIVETNLDFDLLDIPILTDVVDWVLDETLMRIPILNRFQTPRTERDKLYAKRIGLAHVARSLKTMYQGNVSMIGNPYMRPWDLVYLADAYDDYWGLVEIHSCTHIMNSTMGFTTSIEINPIVTVDDPAQWGFMESARRVLMSILHPTLIAGATTNTNDAVTAVQQLNSIKVGSTHDAGIGGTAIYANILAGGAFDYEQLKRYGKGEVALDYLNQWLQGLLGVFDLNPLQNALEWIDGQQDVYVGLLIHNGYPYHAGLKGANGIVVGEAQSTGFDLIDLFMSNKTDVSWTDVLNEIGMNSADAYDIARNKQYILGDIFSYMLTEHGGTLWTAPATGWTVMDATVVRIIDADTIEVKYLSGGTDTIRFAGINAYEKGTPRGDAASGYTYSRIPPGTTIQLKMYGYKDGDEQTSLTHDLYGRRMAWVYVNGANLCIELYTQGFAIIGNSGFVDDQGVVH
jgi:hypothetical protein